MDEQRASELLRAERARVQESLDRVAASGGVDRAVVNEPGDIGDRAERLTAEEIDDAVAAALRDRLAALDRAEKRLRDGTYGRSVRSGVPIPDARLEADPAAELTVEEAQSS